MNLKWTTALSPVRKHSLSMAIMDAVCLTDPTWTIAWYFVLIVVGWCNTNISPCQRKRFRYRNEGPTRVKSYLEFPTWSGIHWRINENLSLSNFADFYLFKSKRSSLTTANGSHGHSLPMYRLNWHRNEISKTVRTEQKGIIYFDSSFNASSWDYNSNTLQYPNMNFSRIQSLFQTLQVLDKYHQFENEPVPDHFVRFEMKEDSRTLSAGPD